MEKERGDEEMHGPLILTSEHPGSICMVIVSTIVAVCGSFEFGVSVGFSSPSQYGIMHDLNLSLSEYSLFGSILTVGAMVGAITSGRIADIIGRKYAMAFSDVICIIGWVAIIFGKDSWWLDLGRLLTGYGIGLLSYVVPIYIAEITPKNLRGGFTTVNQLMICGGVSFAWVLGTFIEWHTLAVIGAAPCIIQLLGLLIIPESPRWLAKTGHDEEFVAALQKLRGKGSNIVEESEEIKEFTKALESLPQGRMLDLLQRRYHRVLTVGVGLMAFQQFGGVNGIVFYATEIFISAGFKSGTLGTILMAMVQFPMTALGAFLMDKSGRRPLLLVSSSGTCLGCLLIAVSFILDISTQMQLRSMLALTGLLVFTGSFSLGMGAIPWVIMSEIFPINMKGSAGSLVTLMNWFGSWVVSYTFNFLVSWSSSGTFLIYTCICGLSVLFVKIMVPETKGRTLEEIQTTMNAVASGKYSDSGVE